MNTLHRPTSWNFQSIVRHLVCSLLLTACFAPQAWAKRPPPVMFEVGFPNQGARIGREAQLDVSKVVSSVPWTKGFIRITAIDANREVNAESDPKSVSIPRETAITFVNDPNHTYTIPLTVTAAGEFGLGVEVRVTGNDGKEYWFRISVTILAEDGQVWFGNDSIESAGVNRIATRTSTAGKRQPGAPPEGPAKEEIQRWLKEREKKQLENKNRKSN